MPCTRKRCGDLCWYCDRDVTGRHDHDHAPIPQSEGGVAVVVACPLCHELKDRRPADTWPAHLLIPGLNDLVRSGAVNEPVDQWPRQWDDMSHPGRLVWAKWAAAHARGFAMEDA